MFDVIAGYVALVAIAAFLLQAMGGKRSNAGRITLLLFIGLPLFIIALVVAALVDLAAWTYLRFRGTRFRSLAMRRLFSLVTGPPPPRQIPPDQLRTLDQMVMLTPTEFELAVGDLMKEMGFKRVKRTGGSGDLAVDLTARDREGDSVAVQCKCYAPTATVGSPDIQKFIGMTTTHHLSDRAIFATTARFTKPAAELARRHRIELWDGAELAHLLATYRGEEKADDEQPGFAAIERADTKLRRAEERGRKAAAKEAERLAQFAYEHTSSLGLFLPDAALDAARESAAARALRRMHPDRDPTEEEIDELVGAGSPSQPTKQCEQCRQPAQWYDELPGHYCMACGRAELWIADQRKILSPRPKGKRLRRYGRAH